MKMASDGPSLFNIINQGCMKNLYLLCFILGTNMLVGQVFNEITPSPFTNVDRSAAVFADIDGDNDPDAIISGEQDFFDGITELYINDGTGYFEESGVKLIGQGDGDIAAADLNGDDFTDIIVTGNNNMTPSYSVSYLYINDGSGDFIEDTTAFIPMSNSSIAIADVNSDNSPDVLIAGSWNNGTHAMLYLNDGNGGFNTIDSTSMGSDWVFLDAVAFGDVNNDGSPDIILQGSTGFIFEPVLVTKLYINDGNGNFTEDTDTYFEGLFGGTLNFLDYDGDADLDVFMTGGVPTPEGPVGYTYLYANDGNGSFSEVDGMPFPGVNGGGTITPDLNNDGYPDILITGVDADFAPITQIFMNDGDGSYFELTDHNITAVGFGGAAFADVNGDDAKDLLLTGQDFEEARSTKLYLHDGSGIIPSTSVDGQAVEIGLQVYPNPASEKLTVQLTDWENEQLELRLYNSLGMLLSNDMIRSNTTSIDVKGLVAGVYTVQVQNEKGAFIAQRIVVE